MSEDPTTLDQLAEVAQKMATAESLAGQLRLQRDDLLLLAKEEDPAVSLQTLADVAGIRREVAHYAVLRARARRGEEVTT